MRLWRILKNSGLQKQCQAKKAPRDSTVSGGATQPTETKRIKIEELYLMSNIKGMLPTQKDLNTEAMMTIPPHQLHQHQEQRNIEPQNILLCPPSYKTRAQKQIVSKRLLTKGCVF
jgi:hypothetical protein